MHRFSKQTKIYCFIIKIKREMKKLVLLLAVVFGMSMVSCTGTAEQAQEVADSVAAEVTEVVDSADAAVDSTVANAAEAVADKAQEIADSAKAE